MEQKPIYETPLATRYASAEMQKLFSQEDRIRNFRLLWVLLAKEEKKLGLDITDEQIDELERHVDDIDLEKIAHYEEEVRHDVMANILAYGDVAPKARPILHLGATSCYVDDNADILAIRGGMQLVKDKLVAFLKGLSRLALKYKDLPCLSYTHLQPAQPTTLGHRFCLYLNEFFMDLKNLDYQMAQLLPLGCKGATGTQASFLDLFEGDEKKVVRLDRQIAKALGFERSVPVSGQTYSRKMDFYALTPLVGIAASAFKFALDLRISSSFMEVQEGVLKTQVGSSAMPYKKNPMLSERVCALARYAMSLETDLSFTSAEQCFERTLDDSANRRLSIPGLFLSVDGILNVLLTILDRVQVHKEVIQRRLEENLPFMAIENILMESVKRGKDRQSVHDVLRQLSRETSRDVAMGGKNDLLDRIVKSGATGLSKEEIWKLVDVEAFVGRSESQCVSFVRDELLPALKKEKVRKAAVAVRV